MKIAMCQMLSEYGRPEENLSRAKEMLRDAARQGAQLALLPECLDLGWANPEAHEMAQPIPGAHSDRLCAWAAEYGLYVCAGLTERDGGKLYNTAVLIDKRGKLLGKHRKINLLTEIEGSGLYSVGSKLEVFDTELGKLGIDICADNARSSMVLGEALCRMGAEIILSPSSWAVPADSRRAYYGAEWYEPYGKLAKLYGADLTVDARPMGCSHNLCVSVTGIKDKFALEGEELTREYTSIALGAAFHPYFVGGTFDPEAVGIEKQMLKKALEDEINDKRLYCLHQANREFFGDSPAGVRQEGYLEEVDDLTPEQLTTAYYEMLRTANIELLVLGCDAAQTAAVRDALLAELAAIDRAPLPLAENIAMPRREPVHRVETYDMVQAKLCMLFTLGEPMRTEQLAAVRLAMALYGGSVTSRLFLNVRERDHLCYYCSSSFQSFTGSMAVNSGVEHADAARAEQAILKELADLCSGPITDEELEDCRRGLLSGMQGVEDTLGGIETWYYIEVLRSGGDPAKVQTPAEARAALQAVTRDDVRAILRKLTLSVSYLLTKEVAAHAAE